MFKPVQVLKIITLDLVPSFKKFITFKIADLRKKLAFTAGLLLVYRLGGKVPLPGIDKQVLMQSMAETNNSLFIV